MYPRQVSPSLKSLLVTLIHSQITWTSTLPPHASRTLPHHSHANRRDQQAQPRASVLNNCAFPVYLWSVADSASPAYTLSPYTGTYSEAYQQRDDGGISLKVAASNSMGGNMSQFEYTVVPNGPYTGIFWDLSHVNGNPFGAWGEDVTPTSLSTGNGSGGDGTCQPVNCIPGQICHEAYIQPDDDFATHSCPLNTDLTYTVCSGGNNTAPAANTPTGGTSSTGNGQSSQTSQNTQGSQKSQSMESVQSMQTIVQSEQSRQGQQANVHVVYVTETVQAVQTVETMVQSPGQPWMTLVPGDGAYALAWSAGSG